jgi:type II secretory pathway component GspD/PulD (secretin)
MKNPMKNSRKKIMKKTLMVLFCVLCSVFAPAYLFDPQPAFSQENQFILPEYSKKISLDFRNTNIKDVLKAFAKQIGVSFITTPDVSERAITVFLENVPVEEALNKILTVNYLTYEYDQLANMIIIKAKPMSKDQEIVTKVYQLRYASVNSSKIKSTISISSTDSSSGDSSSSSASSSSSMSSGTVTTATGIADALKTVISEKGKVVEDTRTNSLVVTDLQGNFSAVERLLARLDVPVPQILIQAEMMDVDKNDLDKLGADFQLNLTVNGASRPTALPWNSDVAQDKYGMTQDISAGTIDAAKAKIILDFLKSQKHSTTLARPRIITVDNETAQIKIATKEAIGIKQTSNSSSSGGDQTTKEAERVETGVFLTVTPQVNLLTNEITLAVSPKVRVAKEGGTFEGQSFKDPEERSVNTILRVNSGDTIFIGGLLRKDELNKVTKVPILGDIPILGMPFRHKEKNVTERELIVFITPYILGPSAELPETIKKEILNSKELREQGLLKERTGMVDQEMDKASDFK